MSPWLRRRCLEAGVAATALLLVSARSAAAHGGPNVYSGQVGPYELQAYRLFGSSGEQRILTYSLYLSSAESGDAVEGASLLATLRREGATIGRTQMSSLGNHYEAQFLVDAGSGWSVDLTIDGMLGRASVSHSLRPPASPTETVAPYVLPLFLLALTLAIRARRRGYASPALSSRDAEQSSAPGAARADEGRT